jgi:hypothetical protein
MTPQKIYAERLRQFVERYEENHEKERSKWAARIAKKHPWNPPKYKVKPGRIFPKFPWTHIYGNIARLSTFLGGDGITVIPESLPVMGVCALEGYPESETAQGLIIVEKNEKETLYTVLAEQYADKECTQFLGWKMRSALKEKGSAGIGQGCLQFDLINK